MKTSEEIDALLGKTAVLADEKARLDRLELEQYRAIFAALDSHVAQNGELHIVQNNRNGRRMIRVVNDATDSIETVHGVTVRDALAQAAQVVA